MRLAIDAGHGMSSARPGVFDPGAVSANYREADIALAYAEALAWFCHESGIPFSCSRRNQTDPAPLRTRAQKFAKAGCTHLISFHCNSALSVHANGTETFYSDDAKWAQAVQDAALKALGLRDRGLKHESRTRHGRLAILRMPGQCALLELGFISNVKDREVMLARESRVKLCEEIIKAIKGGKA